MQTDLVRVNTYALAIAEGLEGRAASVKKLARLTKANIEVAFEPEQIERTAEIIRSYASITASIDTANAANLARAIAAEAALAEGIALVKAIRSLTLPEIVAFWHQQRTTGEPTK